MTPEEVRKRQSEAGKTKDPRKGYGSMDKDRLKQISREAARRRWEKYYESQQSQQRTQDEQSIH